jgi:hypothetical protein
MNKGLKILIFIAAFGLLLLTREPVKAQCSVCSTNVETNKANGGKQANGLNHGIVYLLFAPYLAVGVLGFVWYKKYRRKDVDLNVPNERLNLN